MSLETAIDIDASVGRVWDLTVDIEAWPSITPTMTKVERMEEGPIGLGSAARVKQPRQPIKVWTITRFEPQRCFAWSTRFRGLVVTATHRLELTGFNGVRNILTIDLDGPLAPLVELIAGRSIRKAIQTENNGFKSAAER